jgi:hypothetical protein
VRVSPVSFCEDLSSAGIFTRFEASVGIPLASASRAGRGCTEPDFPGSLHKSRGVCSYLFSFSCIFILFCIYFSFSCRPRVHIGDNVKFKCGDDVSLSLFCLLVCFSIKISKIKTKTKFEKMSLEIILQFKWKIIVNWKLAFELINQLIIR